MSQHKIKKEDNINRLSKILGQISGIKRMIEDDRDCPDILIQISSARAGLARLALLITEDHLEHCITTSFQKGKGKQSLTSLSKAMKQMLK
jgi:DNA-binding FrmR family transcriptional regulator